MATDAWSQTLLPAHQKAIAQCWTEALGKAPMDERVKLVNFLSQLRAHFPGWRGVIDSLIVPSYHSHIVVLTWDVIIETLLENDFLQKSGEDGVVSAHLVSCDLRCFCTI